MSARAKALTLVAIAIYAAVLISTNRIYTILDDESTIIAVAGHPVMTTVRLFASGAGQHEHPPISDILLHFWLIATNYSFFALRIFANVFYIAAILLTAMSARKIAGSRAYWVTLAAGFLWPFAFQYGRIAGWYLFCMFLVSCLTWLYLQILDQRGLWPWIGFAVAGVVLVGSNYFGVVFLLIFLLDFVLFHRQLAAKSARPLLAVVVAVAAGFLPLLRQVLTNLHAHAQAGFSYLGWKPVIASVGFTTFSLFGSVAVAPWFLPLSIPVGAAAIALCAGIGCSAGRRWLAYFFIALILLEFSGHLDVKRMMFLTSWFFLAIGVAASDGRSVHSRVVLAAVAVLITSGWIGIVSGRHYAAANLNEPWERVAAVVAGDARHGATVISENPSFFFYLDYQLGLQSQTGAAPGPYLGQSVYQSHGYRIVMPSDAGPSAGGMRGAVVVVNGPGPKDEAEKLNALNADLRQRCQNIGEFKAAPDPAEALKRRFVANAPVSAYRTDVTWYECSSGR
jgi:hypothetical protein